VASGSSAPRIREIAVQGGHSLLRSSSRSRKAPCVSGELVIGSRSVAAEGGSLRTGSDALGNLVRERQDLAVLWRDRDKRLAEAEPVNNVANK
jgi:hypothetical protein